MIVTIPAVADLRLRRNHQQELTVFHSVRRRRNRHRRSAGGHDRIVRLHDSQPRVLPEEIGGIDNTAGLPNAGADGRRRREAGRDEGAGRIQLGDAFGGEAVVQVEAPDAAFTRARLAYSGRLWAVPSS